MSPPLLLAALKIIGDRLRGDSEVGTTNAKNSWSGDANYLYPCLGSCRTSYCPGLATIIGRVRDDGCPGGRGSAVIPRQLDVDISRNTN